MINRKIYAILAGFLLVLGIIAFVLAQPGATKKTKVTVYYVKPDTFMLVGRQSILEGEASLGDVLTILFEPSKLSGLETLVPSGTVLLNHYIDDEGALVLDLSGSVLGVNYGIDSNYLMLQSIVCTALDFTGRDEVKFLFDGQFQGFFQNGVYLEKSFHKDFNVIE